MENSFESRSEQMRHHIEQCSSSKLTVALYCKDHGIGIATYYYWYKKLNLKPVSKSAGFIELTPHPVLVKGIEVCFPGGVTISIHQSVPASWLRELCCI